jgi:two-component system response regulator MprA
MGWRLLVFVLSYWVDYTLVECCVKRDVKKAEETERPRFLNQTFPEEDAIPLFQSIQVVVYFQQGAAMNERILIIEDDQQILKLLQRGLSYEGYTVDAATDGRMGLILARDHTPDIVILDWMLPGMDGLEVCHRLRMGGSIPILMLTAKDTVQDRIQGLDAGADDYMIKPFNLDELLARVRALLRRTQPERIPVLKFADLSLDTGSRQASRGNRSISLTAKEYELLELFLRHPKQVLTREVIFDRVWGYDFGGESNVLEVYIRYLRQKLEGEGEARLLHTVRGVGYVMRENP